MSKIIRLRFMHNERDKYIESGDEYPLFTVVICATNPAKHPAKDTDDTAKEDQTLGVKGGGEILLFTSDTRDLRVKLLAEHQTECLSF